MVDMANSSVVEQIWVHVPRSDKSGGRCDRAGDCFAGAFLAEFVPVADPFAAARFANAAAALSTLGL
jgi:hypothetical protein